MGARTSWKAAETGLGVAFAPGQGAGSARTSPRVVATATPPERRA